MLLLEVCANSFESARNAELGGGHRIELCQNLEQGGITPSSGLIQQCQEHLNIPIHVLIRPRSGDFVYSQDEYQIMLNDVQNCKRLGCAGVVIGLLTADGQVDIERCSGLIEAAKGMNVTFHRAFDDCTDQFTALEDIIKKLGCNRILTSGGCETAVKGTARLKQLVGKAQDRIIILPGSGISPENVVRLVQDTGVEEVHASASVVRECHRHSKFSASQRVTSELIVKDMVEQLKRLAR